MTNTNNGSQLHLGSSDDKEFLYTVLNLPVTASESDIRERYKQLSIIFHPDKQQNERTKATAVRRFLEVQKAYEVLSDPASRQAYDDYGPEGLKLLQLPNDEVLSMGELREVLKHNKLTADRLRFAKLLQTQGFNSVQLDVSCMSEFRDDLTEDSWHRRFLMRWRDISFTKGVMRQTIQTDVSPSTNLKLSARAYTARSVRGVAAGSDFVGTVQHQFSPRLAVKIQTSLFLGRPVKVQAVYDDDSHSFAIHGAVVPAWFSAIYDAYKGNEVAYPSLPCTMTYSRRLFPHSNIHGTFSVSAPSPVSIPVVSFTVSSAHSFSFTAETDRPAKAISDVQPPSRTGLTRGVYYYSVGAFLGNLPGINMEYGITFTEVGFQLKAAVEVGLTGLSSIFTAAWNGDNKGANAEVSLSTMGVQLKLGFVYLNHRMELPMIVSHEYDLNVAFWTILVPTTTLAIAYNLVLRPLEHKRRMEFFRQARRELRNAQSDLVRQTEETISLLQDVAKRHMQAETAVDGLVIIEGTYGVTVRDEYTEGLEVDVTIPLQALVNKSQLYIPGKRSKAGLQGFRDPVPNVAKSLRVRYTFREREHYAEIPDYKPAVLPLEDHLVN